MRPQRWVARNQEGKPMQAAMQIQARIKPDPDPEPMTAQRRRGLLSLPARYVKAATKSFL